MDRGYYMFSYSVALALLVLPSIEADHLLALSKTLWLEIGLSSFFMQTIPERSILSYLITGTFGAVGIVLGNAIIGQARYLNQVRELKVILYSLLDNQVLSIARVIESLCTIRSVLREIYPILSGTEEISRERHGNLIRNFWSNVFFLKRMIEKVEKDQLYEKLLFDRKLVKAETSVAIDRYFSKLRSLLIDK